MKQKEKEMDIAMKYFVHYDDDYPDNGGIGIEECDSKSEATKFIEDRISADPIHRSLDKYTLIYGFKKEIKAVESVVRIKIV